jgi:hypothetical protein
LWIVSTIFLLIRIVDQKGLDDDKKGAEQKLNRYAPAGALTDLAAEISQAETDNSSLVALLHRQRDSLRQMVTDDLNAEFSVLQERKSKQLKDYELDAGVSLIDAMSQMYARIEKLKRDKEQLDTEKEQLLAEATNLRDRWGAAEKDLQNKADDLAQRVRESTEQVSLIQSTQDSLLQDMRDTLEARNEELSKARRQAANSEERLQIEIETLTNKIAGLRQSLEELRESKTTDLAAIADGQVHEVLPAQKLVYIDLGEQDQLNLGMRFVVFSPESGLTDEGRGKAVIEVVSILPSISECQIIDQTPGQAVRKEDFIANPVYDHNRKYRFAVIGEFDLNFDGVAEKDAIPKIRAMIEHWGGMLTDVVSEETDFLVLGTSPKVPAETRLDASAHDLTDRSEIEAAIEVYREARATARDLAIETLTRARFLNLVGYGRSVDDTRRRIRLPG